MFTITWETGIPLKSIDIVDILGTQDCGTKQITLKFTDESYRDNTLLLPYYPKNGTDCEFKNVIWK